MEIRNFVHENLWALQDLSYKQFHEKLIPTVPAETVIGVRVPALRKLAKQMIVRGDLHDFLTALPHTYYEENNLHAFIIEGLLPYEACIAELNCFLPYVDNWATCDSMRPKCFGKNKDRLLGEIRDWLKSDQEYTVRFGIEMLMVWFLEDDFEPEYLELVAAVRRDEYYVKMMQAWYFATALAKQCDAAEAYLFKNKLSQWVHNKTIQKAIESDRITAERKAYLRTLRRV